MSFAGYGALASAGGGFIQALAAGLAANSMRNATANQLDLQNRFRNEAMVGTFQPRLRTSGVETAREQMQAGAARREGAYERVGQTNLATGPTRATGRDKENTRLQGTNRAKLSSYADWQLEQMIANIRAQDELNRITNFAGGEARVFPHKLNAAEHEFDSLAFVGKLISSLGGSAANFAQANQDQKQTQFWGGIQPDIDSAVQQAPVFDAGQAFNTQQYGGYA